MDALTLFGLLAVTAMLVFSALEDRSPWFSLAFAGACGPEWRSGAGTARLQASIPVKPIFNANVAVR
jgi:hypothetical protein